MSFEQRAFVGLWRNELTGTLTLTLNERHAGFLAVALVIFVGIVAGQAWTVVAFILHQLRATAGDRNVCDQQVQALLRNSNGHAHAAWLSTRVALGWRRHIGVFASLRRTLPVLLIALCSLAAWSAAQLFTSRIWSTAGHQFLLGNVSCGVQGLDDTSEVFQRMMTLRHFRDRLEAASTYERQCYAGEADSADCLTLPSRRLAWTMKDTPCPFRDPGLCIQANSTPVILDTGYINSNDHLGINAPARDWIEYRRTMTCSPMPTNRSCYFDVNGTKFCDLDETNAAQLHTVGYYYGPLKDVAEETFNRTIPNTIRGDYKLTVLSYPLQWEAYPTVLNRTDVQASIFFRTDDFMTYYHRSDDPWFYTSRTAKVNPHKLDTFPTYLSFEPAAILGCVEEQQLCNPLFGRCAHFVPPGGLADIYSRLGFLPNQIASARRLIDATRGFGIGVFVTLMPGDVLLASKTVFEDIQHAELSVTQWRAEVSRWFSIGLILLQMGLLEAATGPPDPLVRESFVPYNDTDIIANCQRQRFGNAPDARNFNFAALLVVLVIGLLIIVLGLSIDAVVGFLQRKFRRGIRRRYHWLLDGLFQQQRLAYEAAGVQPWLDPDTDLPVSKVRVPPVDGRDAAHPRLYHHMYNDDVPLAETENSGNADDGSVDQLLYRGPPDNRNL